MSQASRRAFLKHITAMSSLGAAAPLGLSLGAITEAAAQTSGTSGYRALVCIFLGGGNDAYNTVLSTEQDAWAAYLAQRKPLVALDSNTSIALMPLGTPAVPTASGETPERLGGVLAINQTRQAAGRQFALHPALNRVQQLHQSGRVAVLANVGPLTRPTSKADWSNDRMSKPAKLFSHNDQQSTWQSFYPEGAAEGWGGRMGDLLSGLNGTGLSASDKAIARKLFTCMTPSSATVWQAGRSVMPYQSSTSNVLGLGDSQKKIYGNARLHSAVSAIMGAINPATGSTYVTPTSVLAQDHQKVMQQALDGNRLLSSALPALGTGPWSTANVIDPYSDPLLKYTSPIDGTQKFNHLAFQLQMVARLMDANRAAGLGMSRQLFMVNLGGFDTHDRQIAEHADRMAQLNHAMAYFDTVLAGMPAGNMQSQVTTFTASEFGRTFTSNGDGTDHGWGAHHLIMGGAVRGTDIYGTFPKYGTADNKGVFNSLDQIQNGVMLPTTSVDQYAYTLGKWMGVSNTDLLGILPNLNQFNSSAYDLGFMQA